MKFKMLSSTLALLVAVDQFCLAAQPPLPDPEEEYKDEEVGTQSKAHREEEAKAPAKPTPAEQKAKEERQAQRDAKVEARLQEKPKSPQTHYSAAGYYMERGDNTRAAALADAELAVRLDPADADAYFIRAMARSKLGGAPELILEDLDEAARLKPALAAFRDQARARLAEEKGPGR